MYDNEEVNKIMGERHKAHADLRPTLWEQRQKDAQIIANAYHKCFLVLLKNTTWIVTSFVDDYIMLVLQNISKANDDLVSLLYNFRDVKKIHRGEAHFGYSEFTVRSCGSPNEVVTAAFWLKDEFRSFVTENNITVRWPDHDIEKTEFASVEDAVRFTDEWRNASAIE